MLKHSAGLWFSLLSFVLLFFAPFLQAGDSEVLGPYLRQRMAAGNTEPVIVWIYFRDKGPVSVPHLADQDLVSERSAARRSRVAGRHAVLDESDLRVSESYVRSIRHYLTDLRHRSRWLNAVSGVVRPEDLDSLLQFEFIRKIELVGRFARGVPPAYEPAAGPPVGRAGAADHLLDYGLSFAQLDQIGVPSVHDSGNAGQGVMIGVFDNGFRLPGHEAFDSMQIIATYDFVDRKTSVVPLNPDPSFGTHGVNSLSTIGGYAPGELIGPAFRASFILARTENDSSETPLEEDNWVAAIEWADSIGVDVTSTSLIYRDYPAPYVSWTWEDMDGNSTVITRAADMAVAKGIIVVNSAGNFGDALPGQNSLGAPADGDSVLTVGAVDASGARAVFSSMGPTTSTPPRIKPDIMARGVNVRAASGTDVSGYVNGFSGTSAACPLAAGAAALVLAAFPDLDPVAIGDALRRTASNAAAPNNQLGWGILNAGAAIGYLGTPGGVPSTAILLQNYPNPFNGTTMIDFSIPTPTHASLEVFDLLGRRVTVLADADYSPGWHQAAWNGRNGSGNPAASGVYVLRLSTTVGSIERTALLLR